MFKSKFIWMFASALCLFAACETEPLYPDIEGVQLETDISIIEQYIANEKIPAKRTNDGLFYVIDSAGTGDTIAQTDILRIQYKGYFLNKRTDTLNGAIKPLFYDSTASTEPELATELVLQSGIEGWRKGIPLVKKGGKLKLIIPSKMAYQNRIVGILPKNSILEFDIKVIDVNPKIENVEENK